MRGNIIIIDWPALSPDLNIIKKYLEIIINDWDVVNKNISKIKGSPDQYVKITSACSNFKLEIYFVKNVNKC